MRCQRAAGDLRLLLARFLHPVLADVGDAGGDRLLDGGGWKTFSSRR
jgi:hypothetical protein